MKGEEVEVETANGAIQFTGSEVGKLEAETLNGAIHVDGDFSKA